MKYFLQNVAFILHFRRDSEDRLNNLLTTLKYLRESFSECEIVIINDDVTPDACLKDITEKFSTHTLFCENSDHFKKSYCFNSAVDHVKEKLKSNIYCFWDVDVLVDPKHVVDAYEKLRRGIYDHCYPYNGVFVDIEKVNFNHIIPTPDFYWLYKSYKGKAIGLSLASNQSPGGCTMITLEAFDKINGFDNSFVGWGFEDTDFMARSKKINKVGRVMDEDAICWHMHHDNAIRTENPHYINNLQTYNKNVNRV